MTYVIASPCVDVMDKACLDACPIDCIYTGERMLYIHPVECVDCGACEPVCPVDCIYEGGRMLYIQPDECVDCGACEPACPVTAIFYEDDVPSEWKQFTPINAEFFSDSVSGLGSPGGAAQTGPVVADHPTVASWAAV